MQRVLDIRRKLIDQFKTQNFVIDRTGVKTIELIGESFIADEDWIVRRPNYEYIERELQWYRSCSLSVNDIPGMVPKIWKDVASHKSEINSNYGYLIWSEENHHQYERVVSELICKPNSRRATMIYNRPTMHDDCERDGMNDFICTYANQFFIRDNKLISHYIMRSNDVIFGYTADVAWAKYVHYMLARDLEIEVGDLIWTASSLHVYERHFNHIERLIENGF